MKLSVIIPIYNEFENIDHVIERINAVNLPNDISGLEMIMVDDGSTDGTLEKLEKYKTDGMMVVHDSRINSGKGTAIRIGLTYVTGDIVLIQDADLEYDPEDYPALLKPIITGEAKVVYGSRFLEKRGVLTGMAVPNWLANKLLKTITNILFNAKLSDEATAYKAFSVDILRHLNLKSQRFELCPEITAKILKQKISIMEVPIKYQGRSVAEGKKIRWYDGFEAVWTLLKYRFIN